MFAGAKTNNKLGTSLFVWIRNLKSPVQLKDRSVTQSILYYKEASLLVRTDTSTLNGLARGGTTLSCSAAQILGSANEGTILVTRLRVLKGARGSSSHAVWQICRALRMRASRGANGTRHAHDGKGSLVIFAPVRWRSVVCAGHIRHGEASFLNVGDKKL